MGIPKVLSPCRDTPIIAASVISSAPVERGGFEDSVLIGMEAALDRRAW